MKTVIISLIGFLQFSNFVFGDDSLFPSEVRELQRRRDEEIAKINKIYVKALEGYRDEFMKDGDLKNANLTQKLIDEIGDDEGLPKQPILGEWTFKYGGRKLPFNFRDTGRFTGKGAESGRSFEGYWRPINDGGNQFALSMKKNSSKIYAIITVEEDVISWKTPGGGLSIKGSRSPK